MLRITQKLASNLLRSCPKRYLNLHEYQASELLESYNLPILKGKAFTSSDSIKEYASSLISKSGGAVLKAQVHAGGRGRGYFKNSNLQGGVHVLSDASDIEVKAKQMLGDILITKQTGTTGKPCNTVYLVEKVMVKQEIYLSVMLDRANAAATFIMSPQGGMGIEEIDSKFILQKQVNIREGLSRNDVEECVNFMEFNNNEHAKEFGNILMSLYQCFTETDSTLVEINPLIITQQNQMLICDSKVNIDDNAFFRQKQLFDSEDSSQKDKREIEAEDYDLNYVKLDGSVGCLVNGAGLAMATMDLINFRNGSPANFLDVGGGTSPDKVLQAVRIINEDDDVKSILVNIFGGIVRCDVIAEGVIRAVNQLNIQKPICLCVKGTNAVEAERMVSQSGLNLHWFDHVLDAADKAIHFSKQ